MTDQLYTVHAASEILGISPTRVDQLIREGALTALRLPAKGKRVTIIIPAQALKDFQEKRAK